MPNTCTICKHQERMEIENALARGESLRDIARQFGASKDAVNRHQRCIAEALLKSRQDRQIKSGDTILEQLDYYKSVAEQFLNDEDKALAALDRCHKQLDLRAKLTGAYQKKQENEPDQQKRYQSQIEALFLLYSNMALEQAMEKEIQQLRAIYAVEGEERRQVINSLLDANDEELGAVWSQAEEMASQRIMWG
jgi:DNA-binding FrmR family transcriptional regulator